VWCAVLRKSRLLLDLPRMTNHFLLKFKQLFFSLTRDFSLRASIISAVFLGLVGSAIILIPYNLSRIEESARNIQMEDHRRLSGILAVIQSEPLWQITPDIARKSSEEVYSDPRVSSIEVITLPEHKSFLFLSRKSTQKGPFHTLTNPILHNAKVIGEVHLTMADDILIAETHSSFLHYVMTGVISLIIAIFLTILVLQHRVLDPIHVLMMASKQLSQGELTHPIVLNRNDEIGYLAASMETTRLSLANSLSELEIKNSQLSDYASTLESKVRQRTTELETALRNITQAHHELARVERLASLGSLVAGVAHELNTPIGNCLLVASTLEEETTKFIQHVHAGVLRRSELLQFTDCAEKSSILLQRGLHQAAHLVGDFKQVAVDQSSSQRRQFKLHTMLHELTALVMSTLSKTTYTLTLEVSPDIEMDSFPGPLGQIFNNLISNSVAHAFSERRYGNMQVTANVINDKVELIFSDDGIGMQPEILHRIFEPFFTTRFGCGGSGLGLSIAYNIVTNILCGEINVTSSPSEGSRFVISIPMNTPLMNDSETVNLA